jgi:hypothetical protein
MADIRHTRSIVRLVTAAVLALVFSPVVTGLIRLAGAMRGLG